MAGIFQLALPSSITGAIYNGPTVATCYREVDLEGRSPSSCSDTTCTVIACPSQGPGSMWLSIYNHPLLLLNGLLGIVYYVGEILLYHEPLGLVLIVMAALSSAFLINPIGSLFGLQGAKAVPIYVILVGVLGAALTVLEKEVRGSLNTRRAWRRAWLCISCRRCSVRACFPPDKPEEDEDDFEDATAAEESPSELSKGRAAEAAAANARERTPLLDGPQLSVSNGERRKRVDGDGAADGDGDGDGDGISPSAPESSPPTPPSPPSTPPPPSFWRTTLRILIPFVMLSFSYAMWFVTQKYFNDEYRTNVWSYTSLDQILAPVFMWSFLFFIDAIRPFRRCFYPTEADQTESTLQSIRGMFADASANHGLGWVTLVGYRLLIVARGMVYFYLGVIYDLEVVYLELTLLRVVLSWAASLLLSFAMPKFIGMTAAEKKTVALPLNVFLKSTGTVLVVVSLALINAQTIST